jgi:hypothetical protein
MWHPQAQNDPMTFFEMRNSLDIRVNALELIVKRRPTVISGARVDPSR